MLLARQNKWDRFVMRINQQQKGLVTDWFAFKTENIAGIATEHRDALGKKKRGQKIPSLPFAQRVDLWIFCWTFRAAIPREIVVVAVFVGIAVRFVVLVVIADQVVQRETIVRGHKVDAGVRASPVMQV